MGKHARQRSSRARWTSVVAGAVTMGVLLAGMAWVFLSARSSDDPTSSASGNRTPGRTSTSSGEPLAKAQRALTACRDHLAARERLAEAAEVSARNWKAHTEAQRKLDSGAWTLEQAQAVWDSSMERGDNDVQTFATASRAVSAGPLTTACRSVAADTASTALADEGTACGARDKALAAVGAVGTELNTQWAEHLVMMARKPHANAADYYDRWMKMVADAQEPLQRYDAATEALKRAPACGD